MHINYPGESSRLTAGAPSQAALPCPPLEAVATKPQARWIIRLDGIVLAAGAARDGAANLLRAVAGRYVLVSSNSRDTARTMAGKLKRLGMDVPERAIVLAGEEALRSVAARFPGARCLVMASRVLAHAARGLGLDPVQDNAEIILLGRDSAWTYRDLTLVANEMARGCRLMVSNGDVSTLGKGGRIIPDTGAILAAIEAVAGDRAADILRLSRGAVLRTALERLGGEEADAWLISDQEADFEIAATIAGLRIFGSQPDRYGVSDYHAELDATAQSGSTPLLP